MKRKVLLDTNLTHSTGLLVGEVEEEMNLEEFLIIETSYLILLQACI